MAVIEMRFTPLESHLRTARLVAVAVGRRAGLDERAVDELRLAVSEACSRAVELHREHRVSEPVRLELADNSGSFEVTVTDLAPAPEASGSAIGTGTFAPDRLAVDTPDDGAPSPDFLPSGFGLAVIRGLVDEVDVQPLPSRDGTSIRMTWPLPPPDVIAQPVTA